MTESKGSDVAEVRTDPEDAVRAVSERVLQQIPESLAHWRRARAVVPGGTGRNRFYWPIPIYIDRAEGAHLVDIDGHAYIDCILGHGPNILGHGHPAVADAVRRQVERGWHYGPPVTAEAELAELVAANVPGAERVQFVTSGTEATLAAIRFARAATGRHRVAKLEGGWHGWHDHALWSFGELDGPVSAPTPVPVSAGLPPEVAEATTVLPFNDPAAIAIVEEQADQLACVMVEGVIGGGGVIPADREWLHALRAACSRHGIVFVLDEVITGFSLGPGGAAAHHDLVPDLVTLGKVVGGGHPIGAICGRRDILDLALARPGVRPVLLFGTWTGSPLAMVAGRATLEVLLGDDGASYVRLDELGERMRRGLAGAFRSHGVTCSVTGIGRMFAVHLGCAEPPTTPRQRSHDQVLATEVLSASLLSEGVFFNGGMHLGFVSTAHTADDVDRVVAATERCVGQLLEEGVLVP